MNITDETLEILIGKYIDGEITPSEQKMLDGAMEKDSKVKELLEQLTELHEASAEAVGAEVFETGKSAEEIIDSAWGVKEPSPRRIFSSGFIRFAAGLAAGLLIGVVLHFVLSAGTRGEGAGERIEHPIVASDAGNRKAVERTAPALGSRDVTRNVDYYSFTDKQGGRWLIEGLREYMVRPAVYYGDL